MKVAIPLFEDRVSPHFLTAAEMLVVMAQGERVSSTLRFPIRLLSSVEKMRRLMSLGVDALICGGIDRTTRGWLETHGVSVVDNAMGEALAVLERYLKGFTTVPGDRTS